MKLIVMILLFLLLFIQACEIVYGQNNYKGCPLGGDGKTPEIRRLDSLKNRSEEPKNYDHIKIENMMKFVSSDPDQSGFGAFTEAYVFNVAPGGIESCNCHMKGQDDRDTHITLTPDAKHTAGKYRVIVEVTPRFRVQMRHNNLDWTTKTLKATILHKMVRISGWLFSDLEHKSASEVDRPGAKHNWRATVLEIHPATKIEILK